MNTLPTARSGSSEDVCYDVVAAVAERTGTDPLELDPLMTAVDPDALAAVVDSSDETLSVSFAYEGFEVTVYGSGAVEVARSGSVSGGESASGRTSASAVD